MDTKSENQEFYIEIDHKRVPVSKEFYIKYRNEEAKERMQRIRRSKCMVPNGKDGMRLCDKHNCNDCPFKKTGSILSLDRLYEDYEYEPADPEEDVIQYIEKEERIVVVRKAIRELDSFDRTIAIKVLTEEVSESKVAQILGISQSAVHQRKTKIITILREKLKDFR